jgi:hypothetical protein
VLDAQNFMGVHSVPGRFKDVNVVNTGKEA